MKPVPPPAENTRYLFSRGRRLSPLVAPSSAAIPSDSRLLASFSPPPRDTEVTQVTGTGEIRLPGVGGQGCCTITCARFSALPQKRPPTSQVLFQPFHKPAPDSPFLPSLTHEHPHSDQDLTRLRKIWWRGWWCCCAQSWKRLRPLCACVLREARSNGRPRRIETGRGPAWQPGRIHGEGRVFHSKEWRGRAGGGGLGRGRKGRRPRRECFSAGTNQNKIPTPQNLLTESL